VLTIFSIPKAFIGHTGVIQRNALRSWSMLGAEVEVLLFGDEHGTMEAANQFGATHGGSLPVSDLGTPRLDAAFRQAHRVAHNDILCYLNSDIILLSYFLDAVKKLDQRFSQFLAVGQRWNLDITEDIESDNFFFRRIDRLCASTGNLESPAAMDFFIFRRHPQFSMPPFIVGRPVWDNWMIASALRRRLSLVDLTPFIKVVHQNHDYSHIPKATGKQWQGPEAEFNLQSAWACEGQFLPQLFTASTAPWCLTPDGFRKRPFMERFKQWRARTDSRLRNVYRGLFRQRRSM
jgi:hypothetical protein